MSKIATYLQEHILGEVFTNSAVLRAAGRDGSVLEITPEMVIRPRVTNDIRKIARFVWQLADKGHTLPLTPRGAGTDTTGAAIGSGISIVLATHMNRILELDTRQKLVRVQPGLDTKGLNDALMLHGIGIPVLSSTKEAGTIGGAVANNASGPLSGKYGDMQDWTHQLEVVLATGDLLQTGRLSKRELSKKKGLQTFEGEVYRGLDNLIEDNKQLIQEKLTFAVRNNAGYPAIAKVKHKDGSFDLTPLFIGSQGTLGIISELILKSEFVTTSMGVAVIACTNSETARDMLDIATQFEPSFIEYYDGELFTAAAAQGRKYSFYEGIKGKVSAVVVVGFDDFNAHVRWRKLKKLAKYIRDTDAYIECADGEDATELLAVRGVVDYSAPPLLDGSYVPKERFDDFTKALKALAAKHHLSIPFHSQAIDSLFYAYPALQLHKVGDRQKIMKLLDEYSMLVQQYGGHFVAENGEGRLKAGLALARLDDDVRELYVAIKTLFDPYGILNPGVKQATETKNLIAHLRSDDALQWP